jgi:NAD(P)-dependent dehydrogenase (short-subunit alcohol dehydrogenase family)
MSYVLEFSQDTIPLKYTTTTQIDAQWIRPGLTSLMTEKPVLDRIVDEYSSSQRDLIPYQSSNKLKDKVAFITGGDSGIGSSIAVLFAKEGADIAFTYYPGEENDVEVIVNMVKTEGRHCHSICVNLNTERACKETIDEVVARFGHIDVLVLNHGEQHLNNDISTISSDQISKTFYTNVVSHILLTKHAVPHITSPGGKIIVSSSITTFRGSPDLVDYTATKGALLGFVRSLAKQLVPKRIRVNAVAFSGTYTPLQAISRDQENLEDWLNEPTDDLGRVAHPVEVATAYVYLASCESSCVNGSCLQVFNWNILG